MKAALGATKEMKEVREPSLRTGVQEGVAERNMVPPAPGSEKAMAPHSSTLAWKIPWMEDGEYQADEQAGVPRLNW